MEFFACTPVDADQKLQFQLPTQICIHALCKLRDKIIQERIIRGLNAVVFGKQWNDGAGKTANSFWQITNNRNRKAK